MHKKIIICIVIICVALVVALTLSRPRETITVVGNVSEADVAEIDRVIRRDRPDVFHDFSWKSLRGAPTRFWTRIRPYDTVIKSARGFTMVQTTARSFGTNGPVGYNLVLRNRTNGWNSIADLPSLSAKFFRDMDKEVETPQNNAAPKIHPPLPFESNSFFESFPPAQPWSPAVVADPGRKP